MCEQWLDEDKGRKACYSVPNTSQSLSRLSFNNCNLGIGSRLSWAVIRYRRENCFHLLNKEGRNSWIRGATSRHTSASISHRRSLLCVYPRRDGQAELACVAG